MDDLKPIGAQLQGLIESSKGCVSLPGKAERSTDPIVAVERTKLMFGCYRRDDAADPETYSAAVAAVLSEYPLSVVNRVTDPRSGLPSRSQWLPTVKEVREACEELDSRERRFAQAATWEAEQLENRKRFEASKNEPRVDLAAKYGPNWGLTGVVDRESPEQIEKRREMLNKANRRTFVKECEAAGMSPDSMISPSLMKLMKDR